MWAASRSLARIVSIPESARWIAYAPVRKVKERCGVGKFNNPKDKWESRRALAGAREAGYVLPASAFDCIDCGTTASDYDHAKGYVFWWYAEPVCRSCHARREFDRGARTSPFVELNRKRRDMATA